MGLFTTDSKDFNARKVALIIIAINVAVFILLNIAMRFYPEIGNSLFLSTDYLSNFWTIVSYSFCHISLIHLTVNTVTLYLASLIISRKSILTGWTTLVVYVASAIVGGVTFLFTTHSGNNLVGASAAVMGVTGALAVGCYDKYVTLPFPGRINLCGLIIVFLTWWLILSAKTVPEATIVHLAGLITGIAIMTVYLILKNSRTKQRSEISLFSLTDLNLKVKTSGFASLTDDERKYFFNHNLNRSKPNVS